MLLKQALIASVVAIAVTSAVGCSIAYAESSTPWPSFQAGLTPGPTTSPHEAKLPADVKVQKPSADVPAELSVLSGTWTGWMCRNRSCSTKLAVETLSGDGGTIVYAFAAKNEPGYVQRVTANFEDGEFHASLPDGARLAYRLRDDGNLDVLWSSGENWASGLLTEDQ